MSENRTPPLAERRVTDASILVPCSAEEFGDFISRLLGKPQISSGKFKGPFSISLTDVENFFHLVDHRLTEQNKGRLVQFVVTVRFNDGTAVELPSLEYLREYSEVKPVISTGVSLTWVYLINFPNSKFPERQQIDVEIETRSSDRSIRPEFFEELFDLDPFESIFEMPTGMISFSLSYTRRSWGADIENLLRDHIASLIQDEHGQARMFVRRWNKYIRRTFTVIVGLSILSIEFQACAWLSNLQRQKYASIMGDSDTVALIRKVDFISTYVTGLKPAMVLMIVVGATLVAIALAALLAEKFVSYRKFQRPSFVLLTRRAKADRIIRMRKYEHNWRTFSLAFIAAVLAGVVANFVTAVFVSQGL